MSLETCRKYSTRMVSHADENGEKIKYLSHRTGREARNWRAMGYTVLGP